MQEDLVKRRPWGLLVAGSTAALFLGAQAATAQDINGPTETGEICMQKVFGTPVAPSNRLNCTAKDIKIARALEVSPNSCIEGEDPFTLTATFEIEVTANSRYDAGFFFRLDGTGTARGDGTNADGLCSLSKLATDPTVPPTLNLDGDTCGDLNSGTYQVTFEIPGVECVGVIDPDTGEKVLRLPNCTSWHSNQGTTCAIGDAFDFDPDTKSKCVCDDNFTVPVRVESATITVTKGAAPETVSELGGTVTYTATVTNDSQVVSVTLTKVDDVPYGDLADPENENITDNETCVALLTPDPVVLGPGDSESCTFKAFVSGNAGDEIEDVVEICGDQSGDVVDPEVCDDDNAVVTVTDAPAVPALTKTAQAAGCTVDVTYQVVVSNDTDSPDPVTVNSLVDDGFGDITDDTEPNIVSTACAAGAVIDPGGNYTCTFVGRLTSSTCSIDHLDKVTAGLTDDEGETYSPFDTATVKVTTTFLAD